VARIVLNSFYLLFLLDGGLRTYSNNYSCTNVINILQFLFIRHSLPEQEFSLCANMTAFGPEACNQAGWWDLLLIPSIYYFIWLFFYVIVVMDVIIHCRCCNSIYIVGFDMEEETH
jgi:hypothetical protein